jgi:hypothetical protein
VIAVTDLRDQLADFEAAATRLAVCRPRATPLPLADRRSIAYTLWLLRQNAGMSPDGLAARLGMSRSGVFKREHDGRIPASALVEHARALGYTLALIPRAGTGWPADTPTPDRRTAQ